MKATRTFTTRYNHIGAMEDTLMRDKTSSFASFIDAFLIAKPLARLTKRDYRRYLLMYDQYTGYTSLEEALTIDKATQFIEEFKARGLYAANNACMVLKSFATWIAKAKYIQIMGGGSLLLGLEGPSLPQNHRRAFTDQEMEAIWSEIEIWPLRNKIRTMTILKLLAATGLRRNEARQLTVKDLEIDWTKGRGVVRVRAVTSKGQKDRITRLDTESIKWLDLYLNGPEHVSTRATYSGPRNVPEPLFLTEDGKQFTENGWGNTLDNIWTRIEKAIGIKGTTHLLRHTWATNYNRGMQHTGNNVYDLKREGGWADLNIPLTYTHDRPESELIEMKTPAEALRERRMRTA